jgi:endonuclease YncB( thermonuclease family)
MKKLIYRTAVFLLTVFVCVSVLAQSMVFQGRVVSVIDGSTVTILTRSNTEFRVRCRSISAPDETQTFGPESRQRLSDLVLGQAVTVEYSPQQDGSIVGLILLDQSNVCLDQVKAGLASYDREHASEQSTSDRRIYSEAESVARYRGTGMWNSRSTANTTGAGADERLSTQQVAAISPGSPGPVINERGYFKKDGTYVAPQKSSAPNRNFNNNWSTQGNINPFTAEGGTKKQSRWKTAFRWIGVGVAIGALIYLDAKYPGPTARCWDGTYSYSQHRQGTCSWHGGVRYWLR